MTSEFVIYKEGSVIGGSLKYGDVPKYIALLEQMKSAGDNVLYESTLRLLTDTGHPLALAHAFNKARDEGEADTALSIANAVKTKADAGDNDAMLNWAAWVLRGWVNDDPNIALGFMESLAKRGFSNLTHGVVAYYFIRANQGIGDHNENNKQLSRWLKISHPREFKKAENGKMDFQALLAIVLEKSGIVITRIS